MIRLALEKLSAANIADKFPIARRDFAANGHDDGAAFDFEPSNEL